MTDKRYTIIHLGNPVDCVIKDHVSNNTIGVFSSLHNPVTEVVDLLNSQNAIIEVKNKRIKELLEDNDHKFWKYECMQQINSISVLWHELGKAIENGYEVSDEFQTYIDEVKKENEKNKAKALEQEEW